jgi:hypothetical protein
MARTAEGAALTVQHQRQQLAVRAGLLRDLQRVWPLWTVGETSEFGEFLDVAATLINARRMDSAGIAARYFRLFRAAEDIGGHAEPKLAERIPLTDIGAALRATGLATALRALRGGLPPEAAGRRAFTAAAGSAARLALNGGRDTVIASTQADRQARSWIRITAGGACAFCAMIASRGPEFGSDHAAGFQAHDHCACSAEPFYPGSKLPAQSARYAEQWVAAQRAARENDTAAEGTSNDALNNFRAYLASEGRA